MESYLFDIDSGTFPLLAIVALRENSSKKSTLFIVSSVQSTMLGVTGTQRAK